MSRRRPRRGGDGCTKNHPVSAQGCQAHGKELSNACPRELSSGRGAAPHTREKTQPNKSRTIPGRKSGAPFPALVCLASPILVRRRRALDIHRSSRILDAKPHGLVRLLIWHAAAKSLEVPIRQSRSMHQQNTSPVRSCAEDPFKSPHTDCFLLLLMF